LFRSVNGNGIVSYDGQGITGSSFAFGLDDMFGQPVTLSPLVAGQSSFVFAAVPTAAGDGFVTFAGSIDMNMSSASLWNGAVPFGTLPMLPAEPTKLFTKFSSTTAITDVGAFPWANYDASFIYAAAPTFSNDSVTLEWFERDGTPLVVEQKVYATTSYTVIAAGAAPLGTKVVVVWVEHDGSSPPNFQVRGQLLDCTKS